VYQGYICNLLFRLNKKTREKNAQGMLVLPVKGFQCKISVYCVIVVSFTFLIKLFFSSSRFIVEVSVIS
jgi:hypothetical protein